MKFKCGNPECSKEFFFSDHLSAKYCSRRCAGIVSMKDPVIRQRQRDRMRKYTDEELLENLVNLAERLGRTPSQTEVRNPDSCTYRYRFGSYNNAVVAAGLEPNRQYPPSFFEEDRNMVPIGLRYWVLNRDGFRCQYCGGTPSKGYVLHVDHVVPRSKDGPTTKENLITACLLCNFGKSDS